MFINSKFIVLIFCVMFVALSLTGCGSPNKNNDVVLYNISTAEELIAVANLMKTEGATFKGKTIRLMNDINMGSITTFEGFRPSGNFVNNFDTYFQGIFDGNGYTISNLYINLTSENAVGFISGIIGEGKVIDLKIDNSFISGNVQVGTVAGYNGGTIERVSISNSSSSVSGKDSVGGVVGQNSIGTICDVSSAANIQGKAMDNMTNSVGGIVGTNEGTLDNVSNSGEVVGYGNYSRIGGIVGYNDSFCAEGRCFTSINNAGNSGKVQIGKDASNPGNGIAGGIVGVNTAKVSKVINEGAVTGKVDVGGIIGMANSSNIDERATLDNASNFGIITNNGTDAIRTVGGVVGFNNFSDVSNVYNIANVVDTEATATDIGGVIGKNGGDSIVTNSYFLQGVAATDVVGTEIADVAGFTVAALGFSTDIWADATFATQINGVAEAAVIKLVWNRLHLDNPVQ